MYLTQSALGSAIPIARMGALLGTQYQNAAFFAVPPN